MPHACHAHDTLGDVETLIRSGELFRQLAISYERGEYHLSAATRRGQRQVSAASLELALSRLVDVAEQDAAEVTP